MKTRLNGIVRVASFVVAAAAAACAASACCGMVKQPTTGQSSGGSGNLDAGACVYSQSRDACGCCFKGNMVQCPPGVVGAPSTDAGPIVATLPACN